MAVFFEFGFVWRIRGFYHGGTEKDFQKKFGMRFRGRGLGWRARRVRKNRSGVRLMEQGSSLRMQRVRKIRFRVTVTEQGRREGIQERANRWAWNECRADQGMMAGGLGHCQDRGREAGRTGDQGRSRERELSDRRSRGRVVRGGGGYD